LAPPLLDLSLSGRRVVDGNLSLSVGGWRDGVGVNGGRVGGCGCWQWRRTRRPLHLGSVTSTLSSTTACIFDVSCYFSQCDVVCYGCAEITWG